MGLFLFLLGILSCVLDAPASTSSVWEYRCAPHQILCGAEDQTQGLMMLDKHPNDCTAPQPPLWKSYMLSINSLFR